MKNIVAFSSYGPGNFQTVIDFCADDRNGARVVGLIIDRLNIPSASLAARTGIPIYYFDFNSDLPQDSQGFWRQRESVCNAVEGKLLELEAEWGSIDLVVLAFRRILQGRILETFYGRLINIHPADLSVYDVPSRRRRYVGIPGLAKSIQDGLGASRTSIHFVDPGVDTGELLCLGPMVSYEEQERDSASIKNHENKQKQLSDRPALMHVLHRILVERDIGFTIL